MSPEKISVMEKDPAGLNRILLLSLIGFIFIIVYFSYISPQIQHFKQNTLLPTKSYTSSPYTLSTTETFSQTTITFSSPIESTSSANLTRLIKYALDVINRDRVEYGLKPVELGNNPAAQYHAEDLASMLCLSHWGSNGMKPYMRYTIFGGKFFVQENVAAVFMSGRATVPSEQEMLSFISQMEHEMMYNDASSDWGHRKNILDPMHTHVNIGIAYNSQIFVIVQDFENILIKWSEFSTKNTTVTLKGRFLQNLRPYMVIVYYDPTPSPLSSKDLRNAPYNGSYSFGELLGAIVSKGYQANVPYIYATRWRQEGLDFEIVFDFKTFVKGEGVYTIVFEVEDSKGGINFATSYSIFVK
ncbi:MAG: CAP domain-containing protein [Nitrososphaeria archaeon]|nr:CAP domain-containing protein [Nitrososphaeria archaeon]